MNHFINISDLNKDELRSIIDNAKKKKSERGKKSASQPDQDQPLQGKNMIMIFEKTSKIKCWLLSLCDLPREK